MKTLLRSEEFSCPSCVSNIESALNKKSGVENVNVNFSAGKVEVTHNSDEISQDDLKSELLKIGYTSKVSAF